MQTYDPATIRTHAEEHRRLFPELGQQSPPEVPQAPKPHAYFTQRRSLKPNATSPTPEQLAQSLQKSYH